MGFPKHPEAQIWNFCKMWLCRKRFVSFREFEIVRAFRSFESQVVYISATEIFRKLPFSVITQMAKSIRWPSNYHFCCRCVVLKKVPYARKLVISMPNRVCLRTSIYIHLHTHGVKKLRCNTSFPQSVFFSF